MKSFLLVLTTALLFQATSSGQTPDCADFKITPPKIMIMPRGAENQDIRSILDNDFELRIAITKIQEAFQMRGFIPVDFKAKMDAAKNADMFKSISNQQDIKSTFIQYAACEIHVEVEYQYNSSPNGNQVIVNLTAFESSSASSLASKSGHSNWNHITDVGILVMAAMNNIMDDFLNTMQASFTKMLQEGRSVVINFGLLPESSWTFATEITSQDDLPLSDVIELWISENSNSFTTPLVADNSIIYSDVKIPFRDLTTCKNYTINKFALEIYTFMKGLGISVSKEMPDNAIYITLK